MKCDPHHERCAELEAVNAELLAALEDAVREIGRYRHAEAPHLPPLPNDSIAKKAHDAIKRAKEMNK